MQQKGPILMNKQFRGIRPDDPHGRMALRNPERGFRSEIYFSEIPGEIAGVCSCHAKQLKLDGRSEQPVYQNVEVSGVPHLIRGNRLDAVEFGHGQWQDELDYFAYDGVTVMQSYCFLMKYFHTPLPREKLDDIERFFLKLRRFGVKALLRFAYELSPACDGPDPETILHHIDQLAPLLRKYSDVIYCLQSGFIGKFGEWHSSYNHLQEDFAFHKELMAAVLETLPAERCTMMRYPRCKQRLFGTAPLTAARAFSGDPAARIGHFNDGFLANPPSHGGTFGNGGLQSGGEEMEYIACESRFLPQDGELFWRDIGGAALPDQAIRLFAHWHYDTFGLVHGNRFFEGKDGYSMDVWKRVPVDPLFLRDNRLPVSDSYFTDERGRFIWRSCYEYVRDHLGYRIELQNISLDPVPGGVKGELKLVNRGFSAPVNPRPAILKFGENEVLLNTDVRRWFSQEEQTIPFAVQLPPGEYAVGLWLPDAAETLRDNPAYAIRCANDLEFRDGINRFGVKLRIEESCSSIPKH